MQIVPNGSFLFTFAPVRLHLIITFYVKTLILLSVTYRDIPPRWKNEDEKGEID